MFKVFKQLGRTVVGFIRETPKAARKLVEGTAELVPKMIKGTGRAAEAIVRYTVSVAGGAKLLQLWIIQSMKDAKRKGVDQVPVDLPPNLGPHVY